MVNLAIRYGLPVVLGSYVFIVGCGGHAPMLNLAAHNDEPVLKPSTEYPWYWSYGGRPLLLLGGSDDDNLFQWDAGDLTNQLDRLESVGGNIIRNTMSDRKDNDNFHQLCFSTSDEIVEISMMANTVEDPNHDPNLYSEIDVSSCTP